MGQEDSGSCRLSVARCQWRSAANFLLRRMFLGLGLPAISESNNRWLRLSTDNRQLRTDNFLSHRLFFAQFQLVELVA